MTVPVANIDLNAGHSFGDWIDRTNQLAHASSNYYLSTQNPVTGTCVVNGTIDVTTLDVDNVTSANGTGTITFQVPTTFGDITISTSATFQGTVDLGVVGNVKISGATATEYVLAADSTTNTLKFVKALVADSTTNTINFDGDFITTGTVKAATLNTNTLTSDNLIISVDKDLNLSTNLSVGGNLDVTGSTTLNTLSLNSVTTSNLTVNSVFDTSTYINMVGSGRSLITVDNVRFIHNYFTTGTDLDANIFIGKYAGNLTVGQGFTNTYEGTRNIGIGYGTLQLITLGYSNTFVGNYSGHALTTGFYNIGIGSNALASETTGTRNVAVGTYALGAQNGASYNTAVGSYSCAKITTGTQNVAIGSNTLNTETTGSYNVAIGTYALANQNGSSSNVSIGRASGYSITTGYNNVIIGTNALYSETTGIRNVSIGHSSLFSQNGANYNTAIGYTSGYDITTGYNNTIIGYNSGRGITTGSNNTVIGAGINVGDVSNNIAIGTGDGSIKAKFDGTNWVFYSNIFVTDTQPAIELIENDTNTYSRIICDGGSLYIQSGGNNLGNISSSGNVYITGYLGADVNSVSVKRNGVYNEIWDQGNVGNQIAALPQNTNPLGTESVPLSTGERIVISDLRGPDFVSGAISGQTLIDTFNTGSSQIQIAHNFGKTPKFGIIVLKTLVAADGYNIGDEIIFIDNQPYAGYGSYKLIYDINNVYLVSYKLTHAFYIDNRTTTGTGYWWPNVNSGNFEIYIKLWR